MRTGLRGCLSRSYFRSPLGIKNLPRRHMKAFLEQPVKVRDIVEIDPVADLLYGIRGRLQQRIGISHFLLVEIIRDRFSGQFFESSANIFLTVGKGSDQYLLIHGKIFRRGQEGQQLGDPGGVLGLRADLLAQESRYEKGADGAGVKGVLQIRVQRDGLDELLKLIELFAGHFDLLTQNAVGKFFI